ncbi:MAG: TPM domain-containing protein [Patescibacteria group bacterium]
MRRPLFLILTIFVFLLSGLPARAYSSPGTAAGFVNDFAGVLSAEEKGALEAKLAAFNQESSNEIAIVTLDNLGGDTIENFAVELFKEWGIGKEKFDNGVLLLVALEERQMRIEVGYGLEGALPDATAFQIITKTLQPAFRADDYYGGLDKAAGEIMAATRGEYIAPVGADAIEDFTWRNMGSDLWFFLLFVLYALIGSVRRGLGKTKRWWPGGLWGAALGLIIALIFFRTLVYLIALPLSLAGFGLLFDYLVSRVLPMPSKTRGRGIWFIPGGRGGRGGGFGGSGGGFGGFGGGMSGGGGASGSW